MFGIREYFSKYLCNPHTYQASESNYFVAARANGANEALFNI